MLYFEQLAIVSATFGPVAEQHVNTIDMADDRDGMEASGTRAPRALGHLVFLLINFSDVCSNFISFLRGRKGSGTRVFGQ